MSELVSVRDVIVSRRSIKVFNGQPVNREDLVQIIEDATWAPNHGNREPWRVVLACGPELEKLYEVLRNISIPKWKELSQEELEKQMAKFTLAGGYVFVIVPEDRRQKERLEDFGAAATFIQNMQLLAWDQGIGSCWKTPPFLDSPAFNEALNVNLGERIIGMVQFGYFDQIPKAKPRKAVQEIITTFGE